MTEYPELPTTSVAEFRMAAWSHWREPATATPYYHPAFGIRGFLGWGSAIFAILSLYWLFTRILPDGDDLLGPVLTTVGLAALAWFLIDWKARSRRRERELNAYLMCQSREID